MSSSDGSNKKPRLATKSDTLHDKIKLKEDKMEAKQKEALATARTVLHSHHHVSKIEDGSIFEVDEELDFYLKSLLKENRGKTLDQIFEENQDAGKMDLAKFMTCMDFSAKKKVR